MAQAEPFTNTTGNVVPFPKRRPPERPLPRSTPELVLLGALLETLFSAETADGYSPTAIGMLRLISQAQLHPRDQATGPALAGAANFLVGLIER